MEEKRRGQRENTNQQPYTYEENICHHVGVCHDVDSIGLEPQDQPSPRGERREEGGATPQGVFHQGNIKEINSQNLLKIYEALGRKAEGKVAVKLSTGEPGNDNHLDPNLIKDLVQKVNGTIVECNTAYGGGRGNTQSHLKAAADHGSPRWTSWTLTET